jgi:SapC
MPKQLLIYESAVPLSAARHGSASLAVKGDFGFSQGVNAVPLMAVEFVVAANEYAIVFAAAGQGDDIVPAAVLGIRDDQNLYLAPDAHWQARYVPAFIRRYPFVLATGPDPGRLTLCIDETHAGFNRDGLGERLFGDDGQPSAYTQTVLKFLQEYQGHFERTRLFGQRLKQLGLLEPMQATITTPDGATLRLGSFMAVSRDKLRALDDATLARLARSDDLELVHLHLHSLHNFNQVKDRLAAAKAP